MRATTARASAAREERRKPEPAKPASFLRNLYKIFQEESPDVIRWDQEGKITIEQPEALEAVLHKYFRHNNLKSFQRQLNYFGYYKFDGKGKHERCAYTNDSLPTGPGGVPGLTAPPYTIDALLTLKRKSTKDEKEGKKDNVNDDASTTTSQASLEGGGGGGGGGPQKSQSRSVSTEYLTTTTTTTTTTSQTTTPMPSSPAVETLKRPRSEPSLSLSPRGSHRGEVDRGGPPEMVDDVVYPWAEPIDPLGFDEELPDDAHEYAILFAGSGELAHDNQGSLSGSSGGSTGTAATIRRPPSAPGLLRPPPPALARPMSTEGNPPRRVRSSGAMTSFGWGQEVGRFDMSPVQNSPAYSRDGFRVQFPVADHSSETTPSYNHHLGQHQQRSFATVPHFQPVDLPHQQQQQQQQQPRGPMDHHHHRNSYPNATQVTPRYDDRWLSHQGPIPVVATRPYSDGVPPGTPPIIIPAATTTPPGQLKKTPAVYRHLPRPPQLQTLRTIDSSDESSPLSSFAVFPDQSRSPDIRRDTMRFSEAATPTIPPRGWQMKHGDLRTSPRSPQFVSVDNPVVSRDSQHGFFDIPSHPPPVTPPDFRLGPSPSRPGDHTSPPPRDY